MNQFKTLYIYELKKICMRKIVWITVGILMLLTVYMGAGVPLSTIQSVTIGDETVEMSGLEYIANEKKNAESLTGREIDDTLLQEVQNAYQISEEPSVVAGQDKSDKIEAMAQRREQYKAVYSWIYYVMRDYEAVHTIDEETLYQTRLINLNDSWTEQRMAEEEKAYWMEKENAIEKPLVYGYSGGWNSILEEFLTLNFMLILTIAICLSNVFSEEHLRKTDQLILCSRNGKSLLFYAKIAAGITFGTCCAVLFLLLAMVSTLSVYGAEGFHVALQVYLPICSLDMTVGQAVLLMSLVYMIAAVFCSAVALFLSEALRNSTAVMGILTGGMIVTMLVEIPAQYRLLSQIYGLLPTVLLRAWQLWDNRLVKIFGVFFTNFQIASILYLMLGAVLVFLGNRIYKNYQVSGR